MNQPQELWWQQAKSDHAVFVLLRGQGVAQCHSLHYLQMVTEKIAKAYFWRSGTPPPRSHALFVRFLRVLGRIRPRHQEHIANLFSFHRFVDFHNWLRVILPIAYELERLAPDLAQDGPNPEYPWPHDQPHATPADHHFSVWTQLMSGPGRGLLRAIQVAVERFPEFADD